MSGAGRAALSMRRLLLRQEPVAVAVEEREVPVRTVKF
jgi:hypothetical protein